MHIINVRNNTRERIDLKVISAKYNPFVHFECTEYITDLNIAKN